MALLAQQRAAQYVNYTTGLTQQASAAQETAERMGKTVQNRMQELQQAQQSLRDAERAFQDGGGMSWMYPNEWESCPLYMLS